MELKVNGHASRIACVADLKRNLAPVSSQQFREIWLNIDSGGPSLAVLMNTNIGWLTYWKGYDDSDPGFTSRNPMYDESDAPQPSIAYDGLFGGEHVQVIAYRLSNGQGDEYPASWALPERDIMQALEDHLDLLGLVPRYSLNDLPRRGLDEVLRFLQPEACDGSDVPDDVDPHPTDYLKTDGELTLLLRSNDLMRRHRDGIIVPLYKRRSTTPMLDEVLERAGATVRSSRI